MFLEQPVEHVEIRTAYADSITLLQVSTLVAAHEQIEAATVAMGTPLNMDVLTGMGFTVPPVEATDMVVALRVASTEQLPAALAAVDAAFAAVARPSSAGPADVPPRTTASALRRAPADLVLVSVPGPHATIEAMDAVHANAHVMIFSDNVPVAEEVALKDAAARRGLLVMGPDCGTAVIGGIGLGFANVVARGPVGVVAASGTGCQQLICLLDAAGVGISAALGVGGRDLSEAVGARATLQALRMLDEDPATELIVVVSKPPSPRAAAAVERAAAACRTPVQLALLGPGLPDIAGAAGATLAALGRPAPIWPSWGERVAPGVRDGYLRGLFCGGTLREEAAVLAGATLGPIRKSIPRGPAPATHLMIDFGDDELTSGRAHPMIDPSLRLDHLAALGADPATGVLLLDVVLGHGAHTDPATGLAPLIAGAGPPVVVSCVGTAGDPQDHQRQVDVLVEAGATVFAANADATRYAVSLLAGAS